MPYYSPLKRITPAKVRRRTLAGLKRLRAQLEATMPRKTRNSTLVLGTWNIRNFDDNRFMNGFRTREDLYYIAEIISRFDIVAVQEVCRSLKPLDELMRLLGSDYDFTMTDVTEGSGGNGERLGFIFDKGKVSFEGIAGELVLPNHLQIVDGENKRQFSRTPFMCSFQSEWFKFMFSTVHIYFGKPSGEKYKRRVKEIGSVAKFLSKRAARDDANHILVGDFNIVEPGSDGYNALEKNGFQIFENNIGSNKDQTKFYDQISFRTREDELRFADSGRARGILQFFDSVFREEDFAAYKPDLLKAIDLKLVKLRDEIEAHKARLAATASENVRKTQRRKIAEKEDDVAKWLATKESDALLETYYLKDWRTFHASDHLPLWVELEIDFSDEYLARMP